MSYKQRSPLSVVEGGLGNSTLADNIIILGNNINGVNQASTGWDTEGNILVSTGTSSAPVWVAPSGSVLSSFYVYMNAQRNGVTGQTAYPITSWDAQLFNSGDFNLGTGTFTAPFTGRYLFCCTIRLLSLVAGNTSFSIVLNNSGALGNITMLNMGSPYSMRFTQGAGGFLYSASTILPMAAADTISVTIAVLGNTSNNVNLNWGPDSTYFSGVYIGD